MTLAAACRSHGVTITLFVAPQALLMQVPLVGPLVYVPMQFAAAWLLHLLLTDVPTRPLVAASQGSQVTACLFLKVWTQKGVWCIVILIAVSRYIEAFSSTISCQSSFMRAEYQPA